MKIQPKNPNEISCSSRPTQLIWTVVQAGWNPFKHYVDEDQVDLILRRRKPINPPEYREVQVKWCRTWEGPKWQNEFFTHVSWRHFTTNDFANHRPELFVAFVMPNAELVYSGDIFIFTSREFHELILLAPAFTQGTEKKCFQMAHHHNGRWFLLLKRNKFAQMNDDTVKDITAAHRRFSLLDNMEKRKSRIISKRNFTAV